MSTPSLGRLLISHITLRGPELSQLYNLIENRQVITYDDLRAELVLRDATDSTFQLEEAPLREALNFLLVAGLIEQHGSSRRKASFEASPLIPDVSFSLLLLHHLSTLQDERQRAFILIYRQLIAQDIVALTPEVLRSQMERGEHQGLFAWTGEKITFWIHLANFLGLVRRLERSTEVIIVPQTALVLAALQWSGRQSGVAHSLDAQLRKIDSTFFTCFTSRGRVHRGTAQALVALHKLGQIRLTHSADAVGSLMLGDWRVSNIHLAAIQED